MSGMNKEERQEWRREQRKAFWWGTFVGACELFAGILIGLSIAKVL